MNAKILSILSTFLFLIAFALAYYLYYSIKSEVSAGVRIEKKEQQVIKKLKAIREAQKAFQATHHTYAATWTDLIEFIQNGYIYVLERKEHIVTLDYGADSVYVEIDTIDAVFVRDSIFSAEKYPDFDPNNLSYIPGQKNLRFELWTEQTELGGVPVSLLEVKDIAPVNPKRSEENEIRSLKPLRFGSRKQVTLSGNWE